MNPMMFPWIPARPKPLTGFEEWDTGLGFYFYMNLLSWPSTNLTEPPLPLSFLLHQIFSSWIQDVKVSLLLSSKWFWGRKPFPDIRDISKSKVILALTTSCEQESYHWIWPIFGWIPSDITGKNGVEKSNLRCHLSSSHLFFSNTRRMFYDEWVAIANRYYISILYQSLYFFWMAYGEYWHIKILSRILLQLCFKLKVCLGKQNFPYLESSSIAECDIIPNLLRRKFCNVMRRACKIFAP